MKKRNNKKQQAERRERLAAQFLVAVINKSKFIEQERGSASSQDYFADVLSARCRGAIQYADTLIAMLDGTKE